MLVKYFPHDAPRKVQSDFLNDVANCIKEKKHLVAHAPTGMGKTAATLSPAIQAALEQNLTVFFLTSRHTQHAIVLETIAKLKQKYSLPVTVASIIGKKWMCLQQGAEEMPSHDFFEFCKSLRNDGKCDYYTNARGKEKQRVDIVLQEAKANPSWSTEQMRESCEKHSLCPYEASLMLAERAQVIIADYSYLFEESIRTSFLSKISKTLDKSIIIVDEGHNLPQRIREQQSVALTDRVLSRALSESEKYALDVCAERVRQVQSAVDSLCTRGEKVIAKKDLVNALQQYAPYDSFVEEIDNGADVVRENQERSSLGTVARFLSEWTGDDEGYTRIARRDERNIEITRRCLDPGLIVGPVVKQTHSTIIMSGTLAPVGMFAEVLGFPSDAGKKEYDSPFPAEHRLAMIVPQTTTRFTQRTAEQMERIALHCVSLADSLPGNSALFFPSYDVMYSILPFIEKKTQTKLFVEKPNTTKEQKGELIKNFRASQLAGGILLGVASGSFGEGIDMPGVLKGVIIVGLPLDKPTLEIKELITYYDKRFGKGWEYGYEMPAMTRCLQNAGRCIRSEHDKGIIVFLDERYVWERYRKYIPHSWKPIITTNPIQSINNFFVHQKV